ncbi:hypothetical protein BX600DRAFT_516545 [Xylariales sp. PMI_506]|nr:hypothetical protein BX600DRAFT_516545 [Xylariales sp. PMI_506]
MTSTQTENSYRASRDLESSSIHQSLTPVEYCAYKAIPIAIIIIAMVIIGIVMVCTLDYGMPVPREVVIITSSLFWSFVVLLVVGYLLLYRYTHYTHFSRFGALGDAATKVAGEVRRRWGVDPQETLGLPEDQQQQQPPSPEPWAQPPRYPGIQAGDFQELVNAAFNNSSSGEIMLTEEQQTPKEARQCPRQRCHGFDPIDPATHERSPNFTVPGASNFAGKRKAVPTGLASKRVNELTQ